MTNLEKLQILPILKLYKESPCLWDQSNVLYSSKQARNQAYAVLLEKFKHVYEDATIDSLKKKLENMRTAYKRERRKVLAAKAKGEEHRPLLWYYDHFKFLHAHLTEDEHSFEVTTEVDDSEDTNIEYEYVIDDEEETKPKKPKISTVYISEDIKPTTKIEQIYAQTIPSTSTCTALTESFGKTVGLQLKDIDRYQRTIAEKLISDTIFYARLNKLTDNSYINLN